MARASTCAYSTIASKFVTNYRVDKSKEGSPRSCSIIAAILEPTIFLAPLPGKRQSIGDCCFSSIFYCNILQIVYFSKSRLVISFPPSSAFPFFPFQFCKFYFSKFISVSCKLFCSINFSFCRYNQCGEKETKTNQKDFLSCLVGIEIN